MSLTINMPKLTNPLHNKDLLIYISKFLKTCDKCNHYDYVNYVNVCCMCKIFFCSTCCKDMKYHGYYDETDHKYCISCSRKYFPYYYNNEL